MHQQEGLVLDRLDLLFNFGFLVNLGHFLELPSNQALVLSGFNLSESCLILPVIGLSTCRVSVLWAAEEFLLHNVDGLGTFLVSPCPW